MVSRCQMYCALVVAASLLSIPNVALAKGGSGGGWGFSGYLGTVNATQDGMNTLQQRANSREGGITTGQLNNAYEVAFGLTYRFSGAMYALHFRPSYFYQRADGKGSSGPFTYGVQGFTFFPMFRLYPLENEIMKFYMQLGLGYGQVQGTITEGQTGGVDRHVDFRSGSFGTTVGLGAEFCFNANHCIALEGDYRYLNFTRNVASKGSGNFAGDSLSQSATGAEVEMDGSDLEVKMGGLMYMAGYAFWF
jgi:hypothetical protein